MLFRSPMTYEYNFGALERLLASRVAEGWVVVSVSQSSSYNQESDCLIVYRREENHG